MKKILLAAMVAISSSVVQAEGGTDVGGGGRGIICKSANGTETVELLDLYEARAIYGLSLKSYSGSYNDVREAVINSLVATWGSSSLPPSEDSIQEFRDFLDETSQKFKFLPKGDKLTPVNDSHEPFIPGNCRIEQLAHWRDTNLILVNSDMWGAMDATNKVALLMHEVLYRSDRLNGLSNSVNARKSIGYLFSTTKLEPVFEGIPHRHITCGDDSLADYSRYSFDIYPSCADGDCAPILQFNNLDGQTLITKTSVRYDDLNYNRLISKDNNGGYGGRIGSGKIESVITSGDEIILEVYTSNSGQLPKITIRRTLNGSKLSKPVKQLCQWANGDEVEPFVKEAGKVENR